VKNQTDHQTPTEQRNTGSDGPAFTGIGPDNLAQVIWRNRWLMLLTMGITCAAGLIYVTLATPLYTSTSTIYVEQSGPKILTEAEGAMSPSRNFLYTQAELFKSTPILTAALEKMGARSLKAFRKTDNPVAYLKEKGLNVSVGKKDDIISVSCDSPDPAEAAQLVNAVVDAYRAYHATSKRSTAGEILKILQNEKRLRDAELAAKLKAMLDFKSENIGLAFENRNGNIILDRLESLSAEMTQAQLQTVEAKFTYENIKSVMADPSRVKNFVEEQRAHGARIPMEIEGLRLEAELEQLELQLSDRRQQVTPDEAAVAALQEKVNQIVSRLQLLYTRFAQTQLAVAQQQYEAAREKEKQVTAYFDTQRQEALKLNKQIAEYQILESDWEQTKKLCDILDDRIKELDITGDVGGLNISVLEAALPADVPSRPAKARYMAIAVLLGLVLAGALALVRDWMDQRLHSAEEIAAVLGVPIVGAVPSMSRRESPAARGQKVHLDAKSLWAETYRAVRTAVFFATSKAKAKTILVTSPEVADGKTTVVSNLAIAMAQAGQKTLILEADFRRPMQHRIFSLNHHDRGLSSVLSGDRTLEEAIQPTSVQGLDLLACGPALSNPAETLHSEKFAKLVKLLAKEYDRVIVDSPPVLPVTDAQILASICQVTLLVLRAEKSTRRTSRQARDALLRVGAHVLGVVVNDVPKNGRYGYYGANGYYGRSNASRPRRTRSATGCTEPSVLATAPESPAGSDDPSRIVEHGSYRDQTAIKDREPAAADIASEKLVSLNK
jgi:succinoglycan biosynthesis transport protein ExoP